MTFPETVRPPTRDRQKKPQAGAKQVRVAIIKTEVAPTGEGLAKCSCGWETFHAREKIREDRVDRHLERRHGGQGLRL